jgi:hypothetical protein
VPFSQPLQASNQIESQKALLLVRTEMDPIGRLEICVIAAAVIFGVMIGLSSLIPA